jgi:hypothetical protein
LPVGLAVALALWPAVSEAKTKRRPRFSAADYARHVTQLRKGLPRGFTVVIQRPFVVLGDEPPRLVQRRAIDTVKWAVDRLKDAYFRDDPLQIIDIWLLKDEGSYVETTQRLLGTRPHTPYGFYSQEHRVLVMNIATGGGTLVHEIVHPFVEANFPGCPPWFNEGLGSLYEQSDERQGRIVGLTNWRLAGLQRAIRAGKVPSFEWLTSRSERQFYELDPGTNYGQARYLLYYLQQRRLLRKYYRRFHRGRGRDPTGHKTLKRVLRIRDMKAFQRSWEAFVLGLRFP